MAYEAIRGLLGALLGHGYKSVAFGLLLVVVGLGGYTYVLRRHILPNEVAQQLKEINRQQALVDNAVRKTTARAHHSTERLNHVLEVHKSWTDQPVPADIVNELCNKIRCSEDASKVSASSGEPHNSRRISKGGK